MRLKLFGGLLLASIAWLRAQPNTIINDTFADGERLSQNLPASLAWYTSNDARLNLAVRNNALTLVANGRGRDVWGYFPAVMLNIGDSLTFTLDFQWTTTPPNINTPGLRLVLAYTNGQLPRRVDGGEPAGGYQGYGSYTNPADASSGTNMRKRDGPAAANLTSSMLELTDGDLPDSPRIWNSLRTGLSGTQQANTPYTAMLKITRTGADTASLTTSISGGTLSPTNTMIVSDTSNIFYNFDTVAIGAAESTAYGDLRVTRAQVVQEINSARLINLAILTSIPTSGDSFTVGYVAGGSGTVGAKPLVVRAVGPSLPGVPDKLADPKLELFAGTTKIGENDDWGGGTELLAAMAAVGAFPLGIPSRDAAALSSLSAGASNTMRVSAAGNGTGTVLAEIYDADAYAPYSASTPRLINLSVLKHLGNGLTVGFVVGGSGTKTVLIRAIGPTLGAAPFGIPGTVADPQLTLLQGSTQIAANDNWGGDATLSAAFTQVGAFPLSATSRDAAVVTTLSPGNYTVQVSGVGGTTGVALVEVYEVQ